MIRYNTYWDWVFILLRFIFVFPTDFDGTWSHMEDTARRPIIAVQHRLRCYKPHDRKCVQTVVWTAASAQRLCPITYDCFAAGDLPLSAPLEFIKLPILACCAPLITYLLSIKNIYICIDTHTSKVVYNNVVVLIIAVHACIVYNTTKSIIRRSTTKIIYRPTDAVWAS